MHLADDQETTVEKYALRTGYQPSSRKRRLAGSSKTVQFSLSVRGARREEADSLLFDLDGREHGKRFESRPTLTFTIAFVSRYCEPTNRLQTTHHSTVTK